MRRDCRKGQGQISKQVKNEQAPGMCRRCGKGRHWTNECRSKKDKFGNLLPPRDNVSGNGKLGPTQGRNNNTGKATVNSQQYPVSNGSFHQTLQDNLNIGS